MEQLRAGQMMKREHQPGVLLHFARAGDQPVAGAAGQQRDLRVNPEDFQHLLRFGEKLRRQGRPAPARHEARRWARYKISWRPISPTFLTPPSAMLVIAFFLDDFERGGAPLPRPWHPARN